MVVYRLLRLTILILRKTYPFQFWGVQLCGKQ
jgi:hypothetical protein